VDRETIHGFGERVDAEFLRLTAATVRDWINRLAWGFCCQGKSERYITLFSEGDGGMRSRG
jgi:hypothetical protein